MKDCPSCKAPVDGLWCQICGEGKPKDLPAPVRMSESQLCCDTSFGMRCSKPGSLGETTNGFRPGHELWYCAQHYPPFRFRNSKANEPRDGWKPPYRGTLVGEVIAKHFEP